MTVEQCYGYIGGDYDEVMDRIQEPNLIKRCVVRFVEDPSYGELKKSLSEKNYSEAFRAAHTLKGVCQNLSFTALFEAVNPLTEQLRDGTELADMSLFDKVTEKYNITIRGIKEITE